MAKMSVSDARDHLAEVLESVRTEAVVLERYGQPRAVVVSPERYEELMDAFEELEDVRAFDAALAEDEPSIPWDVVRADLGWE